MRRRDFLTAATTAAATPILIDVLAEAKAKPDTGDTYVPADPNAKLKYFQADTISGEVFEHEIDAFRLAGLAPKNAMRVADVLACPGDGLYNVVFRTTDDGCWMLTGHFGPHGESITILHPQKPNLARKAAHHFLREPEECGNCATCEYKC